MVVAALSYFGWVGYQYFGTNAPAQAAQKAEVSGLKEQWQSGGGANAPSPSDSATPGASAGSAAARPSLDQAMAILRIPAFGDSYEVPIVAGTSDAALAKGVGWYDSTSLPGQIGNFAVAGHRITHGQPFARLLELKQGDQVIVETRTAVYTYVIDEAPSTVTVQDVDSWVLDPVPGKTDVVPTRALITLTTCQDLFHSPDRSVGFGHLVNTVTK